MFEIEELEAGQPLPGGANLLGTPQEFQTRDEVGGSRVSGAMVLLALPWASYCFLLWPWLRFAARCLGWRLLLNT